MTRERWIIVGLLAAVAAAAGAYEATRPSAQVQARLIQQLDAVEVRPVNPPAREWCRPTEATLAGERKLAVSVLPNARLIWRVTVPARAMVRVWLGLAEDAWDQEGDGVLFRIGVSDATGFRDLLVRRVNPFLESGDRRWVPVTVDLTPYSGLDVNLTFNTNASPPGRGDDTRNDKPLWGDPAIITSR